MDHVSFLCLPLTRQCFHFQELLLLKRTCFSFLLHENWDMMPRVLALVVKAAFSGLNWFQGLMFHMFYRELQNSQICIFLCSCVFLYIPISLSVHIFIYFHGYLSFCPPLSHILFLILPGYIQALLHSHFFFPIYICFSLFFCLHLHNYVQHVHSFF